MARLQVAQLPGERYGIVIDRTSSDAVDDQIGPGSLWALPEPSKVLWQALKERADFLIVVPGELDVEVGS